MSENKKYELVKDDTITTPSGRTLYRIKALVAIGLLVAPGELGGYIEKENNLSFHSNAWVYGNACVYGDARVCGNACVYGNAWVSDDARVSGNARVKERYDIQWFSNVGSESGTLTVCKAKRGLFVSRGCFSGTLPQFKKAVKAKHGDSKIGRHYATLIKSIEIWFREEKAK